ncbi:hypothetical protein NUU61_006976 [Penicillium alfredii]|uniref:CENP-V/GFA domain-containing protein n=1 Tax=Penicillium alfredii TaxID=1506179 RepID=A0A9W9F212_9EURO|nr:uncharacterized protein NUU61_006976 [Penicillium alfredii]KAJ5092106.1 hypothetical protein NUU61_006976 [Penicillium alfredii]
MVSISCLCGLSQSVHLEPSTQLQLCHCTSCRAVTGLLCASYYLIQHEPALDSLGEYQANGVSRFFCRTCGAHVFARSPSGRYLVASGVVTKPPAVQSIHHWQVDDTRDGGLSTFFAGTSSSVPGCRLLALDNPHPANVGSPDTFHGPSDPQRELLARCDCGGIEFYITPPDASSSQASSPWADLLVPYYSGSSANPGDVKWWLRDGQTKYLAGTCACTSCRLGSGFPIQTWAFVPKCNIRNADRSSLTFDRRTMQRYNSSPGVYREFCGRCGATVCWHCTERPSLIDVSVGLLRASSARAEDWLEWETGRVSFAEMAVQPDLIKSLEEGLKQYSTISQ